MDDLDEEVGSASTRRTMGPQRVGVRTESVRNMRRDGARYTVELWYPAVGTGPDEDELEVTGLGVGVQPAARDAPVAEGRFPVVLLSHGYMGHRRQLAYLACQLASHGHVVAAPDHERLTRSDVQLAALHEALLGERYEIGSCLRRVIWQHPCELSEILRALSAGEIEGIQERIDREDVTVGGYCLGGWIAMKAAAQGLVKPRSILLFAPTGTHAEALAGELADEPVYDWQGPDTLLLAAGRDSVIPLPHLEELFERLPTPRRLAVASDCDHLQLAHLGDQSQQWLATDPRARSFMHALTDPLPVAELAPTSWLHESVGAAAVAHLEARRRKASVPMPPGLRLTRETGPDAQGW